MGELRLSSQSRGLHDKHFLDFRKVECFFGSWTSDFAIVHSRHEFQCLKEQMGGNIT